MAKPVINLSDPDFHRMITGRYHKSKRNPYDFPLMIFFKNQGQSISNKINLNVLLQFNTKNNLKISQITGRGINNVFKLSGIGKYFRNILSSYNRTEISKCGINRKDFHNIVSKLIVNNSFSGRDNIVQKINPRFPGSYYQFHQGFFPESRYGSKPEFDYISTPQFKYVMLPHVNLLLKNMAMDSILYSKDFFGFSRHENVKKQLTNYGNNMDFSDLNNYIILGNKYQVTLPHVNLLLNSMTTVDSALYTKDFFGFSRSENVKKQLTNYGNNMKVLNSDNYSTLENKYQVILPQVNLLLNNMTMVGGALNSQEFFKTSSGRQESYYSFPGIELADHELTGDDNINLMHIHPVNIRHINVPHTNIQSTIIQPANIQYTNNQPANIRVTNKQVTNPVNHLLLKYHFSGISHTGIFSHLKSFLKSITCLTVPGMVTMLQISPPGDFTKAGGFTKAGDFTKSGVSAKSIIKTNLPLSAKANPEPVAKPGIPVNDSDLHFKTNKNIKYEIEEIKRIALEAKQTVTDRLNSVHTLHDEEIKRKIDIKQLSDQVYQLLDRKITIEKERRGYI
ncbi:MAG: hypothetical protein FIB07_03855 [Candidatus Methanoperedens sp.]|nr:hypothetical protein [Candidatus Methanoperedens sp.]